MSGHYAPLPNPRNASADADRELDEAFESDNDDDHEETPLTQHIPQQLSSHSTGAYDFDRQDDWLAPPPGSPPRPSATALPNNYGNTNGVLPTSSPHTASTSWRPSFFRRAVGALLPSHYVSVPQEEITRHRFGGGIENDGVFANVMAKPTRPVTITTDDGDVHVVPEDNQKDAPPSYAAAQADAVPPYWETTVHAPADLNGDMLVDDLPTGSALVFLVNMVISFFFQFVGFLLTHLLHTSHAAKFGSRAGLGLTLIQLGFYSRSADESDGDIWPAVPTPSNDGPVPADGAAAPMTSVIPDLTRAEALGPAAREWLSFLFMTIGWVLLLSSIAGFSRVKRWEASIRAAAVSNPTAPEDVSHNRSVRQRLHAVFGIPFDEDEVDEALPRQSEPSDLIRRDEHGTIIVIPAQQLLEEERLTRDLRAAGLL